MHPDVCQAQTGSPQRVMDTTCGVVSEFGHAESWWGADCIRRVLGKDWQLPMTHNSTETWHHHAQFRHLTQLPCPQMGYNKPTATIMNPLAQGECTSCSTKHLLHLLWVSNIHNVFSRSPQTESPATPLISLDGCGNFSQEKTIVW